MLQNGLCCKPWKSDLEQRGSPGSSFSRVAPSAAGSISSGTHPGREPSFGEFTHLHGSGHAAFPKPALNKVLEWAGAQFFPARNGMNALVISLLCQC